MVLHTRQYLGFGDGRQGVRRHQVAGVERVCVVRGVERPREVEQRLCVVSRVPDAARRFIPSASLLYYPRA